MDCIRRFDNPWILVAVAQFAGVIPSSHESTKARNDQLPFVFVASCFRVFVFSWQILCATTETHATNP
jgi:hypothetical protein